MVPQNEEFNFSVLGFSNWPYVQNPQRVTQCYSWYLYYIHSGLFIGLIW